ncbi:hypothetical protein ACSSS7_004536 [Eimeria intestinalis]
MTQECPFVATPESIVFNKVVQGVTYTQKVTLRNRDSVGRRLRLEVDPESPFRVSLPIYPGDVASSADPGNDRRLCHSGAAISGTVATGMCVQVGDSPTGLDLPSSNAAFKDALSTQRLALSTNTPVHWFLPTKGYNKLDDLVFGFCFRLPLSYEGGEGPVKALVLTDEKVQELCPRKSSCVSERADQRDVVAIQLHGEPNRQQHPDAFSVSAEQVFLRKGMDMLSLTVTFAPKAAGTFAAWLVFIAAEPVNLQTTYEMADRPVGAGAPQPIGMLELHGVGDLALLTLSEFCGTQWPIDLLTTMLPASPADKLQNRHKNKPGASKPETAQSKASTSVCENAIVPEGRLDREAFGHLAKTISPREIDFGAVTRQEAMSPPRYLPLFVESMDSQTSASRNRLGEPRKGADWEMLRLQLRVKLEPAKLVVVGAPPNGGAFSVTNLSPGLVQELPLWVKNQGLVDVRVSLPSSVFALKARFRGPEPTTTRKSDGSTNKLTSEGGWSTAWLLRADEQELDELQKESDPDFLQQQQECLLQHLAQWDHQHGRQQSQQQTRASAVIALSGLLLVYPSYLILPARGRGVILFTLRASHPEDISITTLLPPLHALHTHSMQQQLTLHNDSDLPVKIKWNTAGKKHAGSQHNQPLSDQQEESGEAGGKAQAASLDERAALLVSLSPSECILEKQSSVSLQISCLGLRAAPRVQARALCHAEGSVLPLQVSFAARCNGVSVMYAMFSQQQLFAAAALLKQRRVDQQQRTPVTQKEALGWRGRAKVQGDQHRKCTALCGAEAICWSDTMSCDSTPRGNKHHRSKSTERRGGSNSRGNSNNSSHREDDNPENPADVCAALQKAGIGLWGGLQEQPADSLEQRRQADLKHCDVDAGGEASFLYLFVCNCCPIAAKVTLQAFTHNTVQQHKQKNELSERHPLSSEEGRPAEAFTCADCNKSPRRNTPNSCEKNHTRSWLVGRNVSSCGSGRRSCLIGLSAEALIVKAASPKAPLELQQLQHSAFGGNRPSFKASTGIQTLQVLARQRRRQYLISGAQEDIVLIPHPESTCSLAQNQSALLAVEIFGGHPGDFHAALGLSLEPLSTKQQWASPPQQRQEVFFPLLIHVRGKALVLPPLQQRIRFGLSRPPVLSAQMTLRAGSSAVQQHRELQQQQQACLRPTCYRSNTRLFPLKRTAGCTDALTALTATKTSPCPEYSVCQRPQDIEQKLTFQVHNNSCRRVRVKWLLFDLGLWEFQQQLQEQLKLVNTLKVAAIDALQERAVLAARKAAAAAEVAAAAAATTSTLPAFPSTARRAVRTMPARAPDPAIVAAEAAAAAAVAAEEAAFYATEAANAAAATGMKSAADGWGAIAATIKTAEQFAAGTVERGGKQKQRENLGADDISSPLNEDTEIPTLGMAEPAMAKERPSTSPAAHAKQLLGGVAGALPAWSAEATKRHGNSSARWRDEVTKLIPPSKCLISSDSPVSLVARGIAAATEVLRSHMASTIRAKAAPPPGKTICSKNCLVAGGGFEATERLDVLSRSLAAASAEAQTVTWSSTQMSATDSCCGVVGSCSVEGYAAEMSSVECQLLEETGGVWEISKSARCTGSKCETLAVRPPRIEPEEAIIAPNERFDVSLHFGRLQTAEGVHRLRAIALAEPLCLEAPQGNEVTAAHAEVAGECNVAYGQDHHLTARERSKPHMRQGQQDFVMTDGIFKTESCVDLMQGEHAIEHTLRTRELLDSESRDTTRQEEQAAALDQAPNEFEVCSAGRTFLKLRKPQAVSAEPLILDFELETKRPWLQLITADDSPISSGAGNATANLAANQNLGTLYFVGSTTGLESRNDDRERAAVPVIRELVLQPALCSGPITFGLSLTGQAFKLHKAELKRQHQHQDGTHAEAKRQRQVIGLKAPLLVTLHPLEQLKLLIEYTPPAAEVSEADGERKCYGEISAFFPLARTPLISGEFEDHHFSKPQRHHQDQRVPEEGQLSYTLLSGILNILHPNSDPRPFLSLGLAALQERKKLEPHQLSGKQERHLRQEEVLLKQIGAAFPAAVKAAAAALAAASSGHDKMGALSNSLDYGKAYASSSYGEGFRQTVSLIGMCTHVHLLLLAPTEEASAEQQKEQQQLQRGAAYGWASYTNIQSPLVIDFSTTHVDPRRRPSRILKLRAVTSRSIEWRMSHRMSSCTTAATADNSMQATSDSGSQQERAKRETASAFELSCDKGTLASHREGECNKTEVTICIRFV